MVVSDAHVYPGFLTLVLTQLFFPKPLTTFLTSFSTGERRKYAGNKVCLNRVSNSQPPGFESNTLSTEPPRWCFNLWEPQTCTKVSGTSATLSAVSCKGKVRETVSVTTSHGQQTTAHHACANAWL